MRILVTGSRDWDDWTTFVNALDDACWSAALVTVVHGACPTGADSMVERYRFMGVDVVVDSHPADWETHGKAAGPIRNQQMVDAGADICLAFFKEGAANRGTSDCVRRAEKAGIPVRKFYG